MKTDEIWINVEWIFEASKFFPSSEKTISMCNESLYENNKIYVLLKSNSPLNDKFMKHFYHEIETWFWINLLLSSWKPCLLWYCYFQYLYWNHRRMVNYKLNQHFFLQKGYFNDAFSEINFWISIESEEILKCSPVFL